MYLVSSAVFAFICWNSSFSCAIFRFFVLTSSSNCFFSWSISRFKSSTCFDSARSLSMIAARVSISFCSFSTRLRNVSKVAEVCNSSCVFAKSFSRLARSSSIFSKLPSRFGLSCRFRHNSFVLCCSARDILEISSSFSFAFCLFEMLFKSALRAMAAA